MLSKKAQRALGPLLHHGPGAIASSAPPIVMPLLNNIQAYWVMVAIDLVTTLRKKRSRNTNLCKSSYIQIFLWPKGGNCSMNCLLARSSENNTARCSLTVLILCPVLDHLPGLWLKVTHGLVPDHRVWTPRTAGPFNPLSAGILGNMLHWPLLCPERLNQYHIPCNNVSFLHLYTK